MKEIYGKLVSWTKGNGPLVYSLKYLPVLGTIMMTIHIGLLLCGVESIFAEAVCGFSVSGTLLLFLASVRFNFCWLHKALIVYIALAQACIHLRRLGAFGPTLTFFRVVMLLIGLFLIVRLGLKFKEFHGHECIDK